MSQSNPMDATLKMRHGAAAEAAERMAGGGPFAGLHDGTDAEGKGGHQLGVLSADERGVLPNVEAQRTNGRPIAPGSAREQLGTIRHDGDEQIALGPAGIAKLRRAAWREHAEAIATDASRAWASQMAAKYGPAVKVWHNALSWPEAYLVGRYGEDVEQWPGSYTSDDTARMAQLVGSLSTAPSLVLLGNRRNRLPGEMLHGLDELPAADAGQPDAVNTTTSIDGQQTTAPTIAE